MRSKKPGNPTTVTKQTAPRPAVIFLLVEEEETMMKRALILLLAAASGAGKCAFDAP